MNQPLITRKAIKSFLHQKMVPDQTGGTYPPVRIIHGDSRPIIQPVLHPAKWTSKREIVVGVEWLLQQIHCELLAMADLTIPVE